MFLLSRICVQFGCGGEGVVSDDIEGLGPTDVSIRPAYDGVIPTGVVGSGAISSLSTRPA